MKQRELYGVKVFVSGEEFDDYKGTLEEQLEEKDKEIERLNNIIKIKTDFIEELLKIIAVARDYELHDKCYTRAKIYEEKLQELKGSDKER